MKVSDDKKRKEGGLFTARLYIPDNDQAAAFYGPSDQNLKRAEAVLGVKLVARGNELVIRGEEEAVDRAADRFERVRASCEG
ncbi:MAG TPA: hypothetical protein VMW93_04925, partial [bacterium]|nr:hypothetical protein [bacterium]